MEQNNQPVDIPQSEEIKLTDYLRILLQYRYLIILIFVVTLAGTMIYTFRQPKIYSASGRLLLDNQSTGADIFMITGTSSGKKLYK